ncbi:hypothetical protein [Anatilimnocola floriformis]|uniref:hypothetical protein n=1 Tax=Anatilimnocola floriformis TaxID=2948575 RepID=UPI0020C2E8AD|nr:hypothetical protein [Anatilimnocola floriformis]
MITAAELAGFIAAHAIWCVSDSDGLTPMLGFAAVDGSRSLERLAMDDLAAAVEHGKQRLEEDPHGSADGVLAYDGRITVGDEKLDAILLEMRSYAFPGAQAVIAVPYTPASSGRFRVHKPKLLQWAECDDFDMDAAFDAFFNGVESHEKGFPLWQEASDPSS